MSLIDLRPALRSLLLANATLSALVGGSRIYPGQLPQGMTLASIVYNEISDIGDYHNDGPSGLARPRYQIDAWALTAAAATQLGLLIKETLDGYRGSVVVDAGTVVIRGVFMDSSRALYDPETKLYGQSRDFIIWFAER